VDVRPVVVARPVPGTEPPGELPPLLQQHFLALARVLLLLRGGVLVDLHHRLARDAFCASLIVQLRPIPDPGRHAAQAEYATEAARGVGAPAKAEQEDAVPRSQSRTSAA
jgi:hypothetical protein